jgi:hypothetical protein
MTSPHDLKRCTHCGTIYPRTPSNFPHTTGDRQGWCYRCANMRQCAWCGVSKPLDRFWKVGTGKDKVCADCRNAARRGSDGDYNPVITRGLRPKANGLYPFYWEVDND